MVGRIGLVSLIISGGARILELTREYVTLIWNAATATS